MAAALLCSPNDYDVRNMTASLASSSKTMCGYFDVDAFSPLFNLENRRKNCDMSALSSAFPKTAEKNRMILRLALSKTRKR
jgi:hypothetical protein